MNCDEVRGHLELLELDLLEDPERSEVETHLAGGCAVCREALERARELNAAVMTIVPAATPSPRLRRRVLQTLAGPNALRANWWSWAGYALAASLAAVTLWQGVRYAQQEQRLQQSLAALEQSGIARQELQQTIQFLRDPVTQVVSSGGGPGGVYYLNPKRGVLLIADNLQPLDPSRTYQMWVIPKGRDPRPAGLFRPRRDGSAIHRFQTWLDLSETAAIAVSVEPSSGSPAPTSTPFLLAKVGS